ncbi:MAG: ATP-grasp domain-containing protein, partial [Pseudoflavonifractor sp.]
MEHSFLPLLFGGDINVYSVARAFHEEYGVTSICYGKFPSGPCADSTIIDYRVCKENEDAAAFRKNVEAVAAEHPEEQILVLGCGDSYVQLCAENQHLMPKNCVAPYISGALL